MANIIIWTCYATDHAPIRTAGAYQLASWLRIHGYTVKVIDFCHLMSTDDLVSITESYIGKDTLAIGVSSTFWDGFWGNWINGIPPRYIEPEWLVKARDALESKGCHYSWILGGSKSIRQNSKFPWIRMHGYAEDQILRWMDQNSGKLVRRNLFDIKESHKKYNRDDFIEPQEVLTMETARGCMFKCRFCSYPLIGKKPGTYTKEYSRVRDEFLQNYDEWGTTRYYFQDDTVNESLEKVSAIADISRQLPFKLQWTGYNRLDLISTWDETVDLLKESGLRSAYFGIESFHRKASLAVGKGWNGKNAKEFLLELKERWGPSVNWYISLIAGLPGETKDDLEETLKWLIDNEMYDWHFFGLNINSAPAKIWKSEFEKDYASYGYSFDDPVNKPFHWKGNGWTYEEAFAFAEDLNRRGQGYCKPSAWLLSELVSLGYDYDELMHKRKSELPWTTFKQQTREFVQRYVENHKKI